MKKYYAENFYEILSTIELRDDLRKSMKELIIIKEITGHENDTKKLLDLLVESYEKGNYPKKIKIPNHPHCTHVVMLIAGLSIFIYQKFR